MRQDEASILIRKTIGQNVASMRKKTGMSQATFASVVGIDRSYLSHIEKGTENVSVDILVKIADGLDVPITRLLDGLDECPPREQPQRHYNYAVTKIPPAQQ